MRRAALVFVLGTILLAGPALAQNPGAAPPATQNDEAQNTKDASYSIGLSIGQNIQQQGIQLDVEQLVQGLSDGLRGAKPKFTDEQMQAVMKRFQEIQQAKAQAKQQAFLTVNAKKPGVKTLESGLQYKELKSGDGPSPKADDTVTVHYKGTLTDGTVFDSSYQRNMPATFPVNGVIKGWTEALQLMQVGDRWQLVIPGDLAYGPRGTPDGRIGPNETLVFEVELLGIKE